MNMSEYTYVDSRFLQLHTQNRRIARLRNGRIMHQSDARAFAPFILSQSPELCQRKLQPNVLAIQNLFVFIRKVLILRQDPSPRTAHMETGDRKRIVSQKT